MKYWKIKTRIKSSKYFRKILDVWFVKTNLLMNLIAPLAKDLRILIRNKIKEGNKDKEIYKFLTDRYGDFILLKPPFN